MGAWLQPGLALPRWAPPSHPESRWCTGARGPRRSWGETPGRWGLEEHAPGIDPRKPRPGPQAPPRASRLLPGCGSGPDSTVRGWTLRGGPEAALGAAGDMDPSRAIQHEISSLKGAGGAGPSWGAVTSGGVQPRGAASGAAAGAASGKGRWSADTSGPGPVREPPGLGSAQDWRGRLPPLPRSPAVSRGRGGFRGAGRGGGACGLLPRGGPLSPPDSPEPGAAAPSPARVRGAGGSLRGGAGPARPGPAHTAVLCSGAGWRAARGPGPVALETCSGRRSGQGAASLPAWPSRC